MEPAIDGSILPMLRENADSLGNCCLVQILRGVQVLVIDNDKDSGEVYEIMLNRVNAIVTLSNSVKNALEILDWLIPNIIVCETRFLGESIYRLIEKLQFIEVGSGNHIPIIVTSTCNNGSREQIPGIEFENYLLKPFDPEQLVLTIANLMQIRKNNLLLHSASLYLSIPNYHVRHKSFINC
jgi:response regulator RpfG family c-di-GMP phosphodiesterase